MRELYKKYRPKKLEDVYGQDGAVKSIKSMLESKSLPHTMLFTGPSGCGKTTLARILARKLKCAKIDYTELNAANTKGIDMVRQLQQHVGLAPASGKCRVWVIDECHELTSQAQEAFLKLLEDTPKHAYFFLATTDPKKLKKTIRTRSTEVKVKDLTASETESLVKDILKKEEKNLSDEVIEKLTDRSEGSARKCLVLLHQIIHLEEEEDQLNAIADSQSEAQAIELARALMDKNVSWSKLAGILKKLDDDPEGIRRMVLGYANAVLLGGKQNQKAYNIICAFSTNYFDTGKAGLACSCYEVVFGTNG